MKPDAQKSGEAAATLAAISLRRGCPARQTPYEELRRELEKTGCLAPWNEHLCTRQADGTGRPPEFIANNWYTNPDDILRGLTSDAPGFALWSAKRLDGPAAETLARRLLQNCDACPAAALALALRSDPRCEGAILRLLADRSGAAPRNGWTFNHLYLVSAISAAGRLGLASAVRPLRALALDPDSGKDIPLTRDDAAYAFMTGPEDVHFQLATHALTALCEIARAHPELGDIVPDADETLSVSLVCRRDLRLEVRLRDFWENFRQNPH